MHLADSIVGLLPRQTAANALLESLATPLHISIKYVIEGYLSGAALDDVATDFPEQGVEPLSALVVLRIHPDDPYDVE